ERVSAARHIGPYPDGDGKRVRAVPRHPIATQATSVAPRTTGTHAGSGSACFLSPVAPHANGQGDMHGLDRLNATKATRGGLRRKPGRSPGNNASSPALKFHFKESAT